MKRTRQRLEMLQGKKRRSKYDRSWVWLDITEILSATLQHYELRCQPNKVEWGEAQDKAYQSIKALVTKEPVLRLPDPGETYFLQTEASDCSIGAVLMQKYDGKLFSICYAAK